MPVVNFGLHIALGQAFHSDMAKPYITDGDIVVLVPATYGYADTKIKDGVLAWIAIENRLDMWKGISQENYTVMIEAFPAYLRKTIDRWITHTGNLELDSIFSRSSFNIYGDYSRPRPDTILTDYNYWFSKSGLISDAMKDYWNEYNNFVTGKNAMLFMSCPPILIDTLFEDTDLPHYQQLIDEGLNFSVISRLSDYVYPSEYFYDATLHLNDTGVPVRTQQLISDLEQALAN